MKRIFVLYVVLSICAAAFLQKITVLGAKKVKFRVLN